MPFYRFAGYRRTGPRYGTRESGAQIKTDRAHPIVGYTAAMPGILDFFKQAVGGNSGGAEALRAIKNAGAMAETVEVYSSPEAQALLINIILPWASHISRHAPGKWGIPENTPNLCFVESGPAYCQAPAVGVCLICRRPLCLNHALVSVDASLVCYACMKTYAKVAKPWVPPKQPRQRTAAQTGLAWAYELLGVDEDATDAEVKKAYKQAVARYHPDRAADAAAAKADAQVFKTIQGAYAQIKQQRARS